MITVEQAREYLEGIGVTLPDFVLEVLVEQANSIEECLALHYSAAVARMIQVYLVALMGMAQGDKYVSSESAPSGASRSYRYKNAGDAWRGTLGLLRQWDPHGCATGLVPPDPTVTARAAIFSVRGNDCGGCGC